MQKIVLAPDSFKGSLSATEACTAMAAGIHAVFPGCEVVAIPMADGGEGSTDCYLAAVGGEKIAHTVTGPLSAPTPAFYALLHGDGAPVAVVEMAAAAGLTLLTPTERDPLRTTTYGVGELILAALERGARRVILGLGGSATNDGGAGMAAALGVRFFDERGTSFTPVGGTLRDIARVDASALHPLVRQAEFIAMCDIENPLCGPRGAAAVFGPQKGADSAAVELLDAGLAHLAAVAERDLGLIMERPGAGAAGGMGGGAAVFLGAELKMGAEVMLDTANFEHHAAGADAVLTGEGSLDSQTLSGKVVLAVARRSAALGLPVYALAGRVEHGLQAALGAEGVIALPIVRMAQPLEDAMRDAEVNLRETAELLMRLIKSK